MFCVSFCVSIKKNDLYMQKSICMNEQTALYGRRNWPKYTPPLIESLLSLLNKYILTTEITEPLFFEVVYRTGVSRRLGWPHII